MIQVALTLCYGYRAFPTTKLKHFVKLVYFLPHHAHPHPQPPPTLPMFLDTRPKEERKQLLFCQFVFTFQSLPVGQKCTPAYSQQGLHI